MDENTTSFALNVSGWLIPDIRRHVFVLVWCCGVPVHVRYIIQLLRMSSVPLEMMMSSSDEGSVEKVEKYDSKNHGAPHSPSESELRSVALDIAFTQVGSDCCKANSHVVEACLSEERWAEVRSLSCVATSDTDGGGTATRIVSSDPTVNGEVLVLLPPGEVPQAELVSAYFTALDQARFFERQYKMHVTCPPDGFEWGKTERNEVKKHPSLGSANRKAGVEVIVIGSSDDDDEGDQKMAEVVVLDDSDDETP
ncbi:hypothetical protein, conserved [Trypanosoma brucei gambiense DAL972]|uniref:Uncharacterized protein n=2 Tax=Trypanosoma brucei TaxID=5691 RepID=D0A9N4_TRYB9|nr:hypothetical protein, conserved [Trypanosoma brucei gambiense DAL972]RHW67481.1 hypothetical protein DPX39_110112700 [Trypanosoma brucei equiperdum]CBH18385.1 hypothetical protein, conserved [Trypanosoma brucei gambiense DAL972]|eukprot:XP_011780649.1 hypothetical protein, conserved [Trypanosoma brucei gambiense DAL972]